VAEVFFTEDALDDLERLDKSVVRRVLAKVGQLRVDAEAGHPLGSRSASNLTGFRKLLVADRQYRVVYRIDGEGDVCVVWVVANRADDEVYATALKRLRDRVGADPAIVDFTAIVRRLSRR
jgi:mRNA interferase RelE/StbE